LASDVSVLAEDIAGLRTKLTHQDAEIAQLREGLFTRTEELAGTVEQSVASERREVQAVLDTVRSSMRKQNEQNQQVLSSLHSSQQRLASQISDVDDRQSQKTREVEVRPDILGNSTTSTNIFTHSTVLSPLSLPFSFRVRVVLCCVVLCCVVNLILVFHFSNTTFAASFDFYYNAAENYFKGRFKFEDEVRGDDKGFGG